MHNNGTQNRILEYIQTYPGLTPREIMDDLELTKGQVHMPLKRLALAQLIKREKDGGFYPYDFEGEINIYSDASEDVIYEKAESNQVPSKRSHYNDLMVILKERLSACTDDRIFTDLLREARLLLKEGRF